MAGQGWRLEAAPRLLQSGQETSFIGGSPRIPVDCRIPSCSLCHANLTFFFQVAFPDSHVWEGLSLAVFYCTSCYDDRYYVPRPPWVEFPRPGWRDIELPAGYLAQYQRNFRVVVFSAAAGVLRGDLAPRLEFRPLTFVRQGGERSLDSECFGLAGAAPDWHAGEDGAPGLYAGRHEMEFLLQVETVRLFRRLPGAPAQMALERVPPEYWMAQVPSLADTYTLFDDGWAYFFGARDRSSHDVWILCREP